MSTIIEKLKKFFFYILTNSPMLLLICCGAWSKGPSLSGLLCKRKAKGQVISKTPCSGWLVTGLQVPPCLPFGHPSSILSLRLKTSVLSGLWAASPGLLITYPISRTSVSLCLQYI